MPGSMLTRVRRMLPSRRATTISAVQEIKEMFWQFSRLRFDGKPITQRLDGKTFIMI